MNVVNDLIKIVKKNMKNAIDVNFNQSETLLCALFIIYLVLNLETPTTLTNAIDSSLGNIVVLVFTIGLFYTKNPYLIVLGVASAYKLINQTSMATGSFGIDNYLQNEEKKQKAMKEYNAPREQSLEEEMVENITPLVKGISGNAEYKPIVSRTQSNPDKL
jgi:hypothetical protein